MNTIEIENICKNLFGSLFEGVFSRDTLPVTHKSDTIFIFNTDTSNLPGQHWLAVIIRNKVGYVFDPLGILPLPLRIINWMNRRYTQWSNNIRQVQPVNSIACGQYCIYYLYHANLLIDSTFESVFKTIFPAKLTMRTYEENVEKHFKDLLLLL